MSKYYEGVGRRKTATARVRLTLGEGEMKINNSSVKEYFYELTDPIQIIQAPLEKAGKKGDFDLSVIARGGGKKGQIEAVRLGIARALVEYDKDLKPALKKEGFLTRDPRMKERKKPGKKKARRGAQWQKR